MPIPKDRIYLDYNATAPMRPGVRACMVERLGAVGNASSVHAEGRTARAVIEEAREAVAALAEVSTSSITFTSGATEAAGLVLSPDLTDRATSGPADRLLASATEHLAVLHGHRFPYAACETVPVDHNGVIDLAHLQAIVDRTSGRVVFALQAANGETGVIQPVAEAAGIVHARQGLVVCDAVQAAGRIDCRAAALGADVLILSAHKLGGPQGIGAVVAVNPELRFGRPLVAGGGQEQGLRGGTENVAAIAGFGVAARSAADLSDVARLAALRDRLEGCIATLAPEAVVFGRAAMRLANTSAFALPGIANQTLLIALDLGGVAVSTGSACSSGKVSRSHVLEAMGVDAHLRDGMIRVSLGWATTSAELDRFVEVLATAVDRITRRGMRPAA